MARRRCADGEQSVLREVRARPRKNALRLSARVEDSDALADGDRHEAALRPNHRAGTLLHPCDHGCSGDIDKVKAFAVVREEPLVVDRGERGELLRRFVERPEKKVARLSAQGEDPESPPFGVNDDLAHKGRERRAILSKLRDPLPRVRAEIPDQEFLALGPGERHEEASSGPVKPAQLEA